MVNVIISPDVHKKFCCQVDRLEKSGSRQDVAKSITASGTEMEASVLAANINRILQVFIIICILNDSSVVSLKS